MAGRNWIADTFNSFQTCFACAAGHPHCHLLEITIASLDNPNAIQPQVHIYTESQLYWINNQDGLPRFKEDKH